ncbi:MAG: pentapeptide repeat-containing protein [Candidatus Nanopelagicales bacterium]|nr:pentapeptide repeat-containing protein [Candidatus Nanopelagicales bacterium]MDZ4248592.1 pentapeptide repeat-containing protein [Candidatus Nanopelagicales bacterium]MDZ7577963.1 pentapeptide repeat-containing protein [Candidatus Nanopelagicales bacterium]
MNCKRTGVAALGLGAVLLVGACAARTGTEPIREADPPSPAASQNLRDCSDIAKEPAADLSNCDLRHALLRWADLRGADLGWANLSRANLMDANLMDANLRRVNLTGAYLGEADLRGADVLGAVLTGTDLRGALWTDGSVCGPASIGECRR